MSNDDWTTWEDYRASRPLTAKQKARVEELKALFDHDYDPDVEGPYEDEE